MRAPPSLLTELMPLAEATAACYHIVAPGRRRMSQAELDQARMDMSVALANLVPVFGDDQGQKHPLPAEEIYARFNNSGATLERMSGLYVRRSDVVHALEQLLRHQALRSSRAGTARASDPVRAPSDR